MIVYLNLFPATPCKQSSLQCIYKHKYCNLFINFTNVKNQVLISFVGTDVSAKESSMWKKVEVPGKTHVSQLAMTIPSYILLMSIKGIGLGLQQWWASALPLSFLDNCFTVTLTNTTNNPIPPKCCHCI